MRGITLLEMLFAVGILLLLAVFSVNVLSLFKKATDLSSSADRIISQVESARSRTIFADRASQYGVFFETSTTTLFSGVSYTKGASGNEVYSIPTAIEISSISLNGGGTTVVFEKLTGETNQYGTIILRLKNNTERVRTIEIKKSGVVSID